MDKSYRSPVLYIPIHRFHIFLITRYALGGEPCSDTIVIVIISATIITVPGQRHQFHAPQIERRVSSWAAARPHRSHSWPGQRDQNKCRSPPTESVSYKSFNREGYVKHN